MRRVLVYLCFVGSVLCAAQELPEIIIPLIGEPDTQEVFDTIPELLYIQKLTYQSDIYISRHELIDLLGFDEQQQITRTQFEQGLDYLRKKNKFESGLLTFKEYDMGVEMHLKLTGLWTFSKLVISGTLIGKDRYKQYYLLEPGELFDEQKHAHSLEGIREGLKSYGYFNPIIDDRLTRDDTTKTITVTIKLKQGDRFLFADSNVIIKAQESMNAEEQARLTAKLKKNLSKALRGNYYSKNLVDEEVQKIKEYLIRKGYLNASIELEELINDKQERVQLTFTLFLQHKRAFEFLGNKYFTRSQLLETIILFGKSAILIPPWLIAEEITKIYKKKGFWDVKITWKEDGARLFFLIREGSRIQITDVELVGATYFSHEKLADFFSSFIQQKNFDRELLKKAVDTCIQAYVQQGFWNCALLHEEYVPLTEQTYKLVITIREGAQRLLKSIELEKFEEVITQGPFARFNNLTAPIPFDVHYTQEQHHWLVRYCKDKGYLYATPKPELIEEEDGIRVIWRFTGSLERVKFGKTIILGSSKTHTACLTRELAYKEGDFWDKKKIDSSLKRLKALGIFDSVSLYPVNIAVPEASKVMALKFLEDDPFEIRTRAGFQFIGRNFHMSGITYTLGGSLLWKNPTKTADTTRIDADFSRYMTDVVFCYTMPWIFNQPIKTEYKIYSTRYDQPIVLGCRERLYRESQDGFLVSLTRNFGAWKGGFTTGVEWMEISGLSSTLAKKLHFEPHLIGKKIPYIGIEPTLFGDFLDNSVQPTYGTLSVFSIKGMFPLDLSNAFFIKFLAEQTFFMPVYKKMVLGLRIRMGHIFNQNFKNIMPPERFYLGGSHSLRGYAPDLAPPLSCYTDPCGVSRLVPIGGKSMFNINLELRFPMYKTIDGVLFTDLGALAQDKIAQIQPQNMLGSTGFGLRYNTPVGALRFDIGWKWKKSTPQEHAYAWFLTLGQAF